MVTSKPLVFISHIHEDSAIAAALENFITTVLLNGVEIFNTSNRKSLKPGDAWGELIINNISSCAVALIIATPQSVTSPWVNFESGGAWISKRRVIPCCARGMRKSSLPKPLGDLHALEIDKPHDVEELVELLAGIANLSAPPGLNYEQSSGFLKESWSTEVTDVRDEEVVNWLNAVKIRPNTYKGKKIHGTFHVSNPDVVTRTETKQFHGEEMRPGETIRCHIKHSSVPYNTFYYCFANPNSAAILLEEPGLPSDFKLNLKCLGQIKIFTNNIPIMSDDDEDRSTEYEPALLIEGVTRLQKENPHAKENGKVEGPANTKPQGHSPENQP